MRKPMHEYVIKEWPYLTATEGIRPCQRTGFFVDFLQNEIVFTFKYKLNVSINFHRRYKLTRGWRLRWARMYLGIFCKYVKNIDIEPTIFGYVVTFI